MRTAKRPSLIWCVEDYAQFRRQFAELVKLWFPKAQFEAFPDAMAMSKATGSPDVILLDVAGMTGGITPGSGVGIENFVRLAERAIREHPGAVVGVYSAVGGWAKDIVSDVKAALPETVVEQFDGMDHDDLKRFLREHLS